MYLGNRNTQSCTQRGKNYAIFNLCCLGNGSNLAWLNICYKEGLKCKLRLRKSKKRSNFYWDDFQPQKWPSNWAQGFDSSIVFHALKWPDFQAPHQSKVDGCQAKKIPKHLRVCQDSRKLQSVLIKQTCLVPRMNNWGCKEKTALLHHHHFAQRKSVFELITFIFEIELLVGK